MEETSLNIVNFGGTANYQCEKCKHRYRKSYREMTEISNGALKYCSNCGRKIVELKVDGVPLGECDQNTYRWAKGMPPVVFGRVWDE